MAQKTISFKLTMPNVGSWNGKWSGADSKYYLIWKVADRYLNSKEYFKTLLETGKDTWYYSWNDGWGASIKAEIIDGKEAARRKKASKGFCGYQWMVDSIKYHGEIQTENYWRQNAQSPLPQK